jgi:hypothetical protein
VPEHDGHPQAFAWQGSCFMALATQMYLSLFRRAEGFSRCWSRNTSPRHWSPQEPAAAAPRPPPKSRQKLYESHSNHPVDPLRSPLRQIGWGNFTIDQW